MGSGTFRKIAEGHQAIFRLLVDLMGPVGDFKVAGLWSSVYGVFFQLGICSYVYRN